MVHLIALLLPPASEGWGRYCFHRCVPVKGGGGGYRGPLVSGAKSFLGGRGGRVYPYPGPGWGVPLSWSWLDGRVLQSGLRTKTPLLPPPPRPGPVQGYPIPIPPARTRTGVSSPHPRAGHAIDRIQSGRYASCVLTPEDFLVTVYCHVQNAAGENLVNWTK